MDRKKVNILVFPCGSENASEIYDALRYSLHVNIYGASSIEDYCSMLYNNYIGGLPNIKDDDFDVAFKKVLNDKEIDMIFATHDTIMEYLSSKVNYFDTYLVNGNKKTNEIARRKSLTYTLFKKYEWCPSIYKDIEHIGQYPVIIKPDLGQGAQDIHIINDEQQAKILIEKVDKPLLVEYLPGNEITVDCFTDREKKLIYIGPRTRERVRAGISMKSSFIEKDIQIQTIAKDINENLTLRGPWFFQLKKDKNENWKLLEICTRVAGTMVAQRAKGVNLPLLTAHDFMDRNVTILENKIVSRIERRIKTKAVLAHEYRYIYIDFDDTIIVNNLVNVEAIAFLYKSKNNNKKIFLITRHEHDIKKTLKKYSIDRSLFEDIIIIKDKTLKSYFIKKDSIFIDNYFPERKEVYENLNIPVFDVDFLEFLGGS